jgi:hypothetical protein
MPNNQDNRGQGNRTGDNQRNAGVRSNDMGSDSGTTGGNRGQGRGSSRRGDETGGQGTGRGSQGTRKKEMTGRGLVRPPAPFLTVCCDKARPALLRRAA